MRRRYVLDTNIVSETQKPAPNPLVASWMEAQVDDDLYISTIVLGEIKQGILQLAEGRRKQALLDWFDGPTGPMRLFAGRVLAFDIPAALIWAELIAEGRRAGRPRSAIDMQIAAIACANGCAVVTCNAQHFEPVRERVEIVDPTST